VEVIFRATEIAWNDQTAHVHAYLILRPLTTVSDDD
jgi:hypothetical protein